MRFFLASLLFFTLSYDVLSLNKSNLRGMAIQTSVLICCCQFSLQIFHWEVFKLRLTGCRKASSLVPQRLLRMGIPSDAPWPMLDVSLSLFSAY